MYFVLVLLADFHSISQLLGKREICRENAHSFIAGISLYPHNTDTLHFVKISASR